MVHLGGLSQGTYTLDVDAPGLALVSIDPPGGLDVPGPDPTLVLGAIVGRIVTVSGARVLEHTVRFEGPFAVTGPMGPRLSHVVSDLRARHPASIVIAAVATAPRVPDAQLSLYLAANGRRSIDVPMLPLSALSEPLEIKVEGPDRHDLMAVPMEVRTSDGAIWLGSGIGVRVGTRRDGVLVYPDENGILWLPPGRHELSHLNHWVARDCQTDYVDAPGDLSITLRSTYQRCRFVVTYADGSACRDFRLRVESSGSSQQYHFYGGDDLSMVLPLGPMSATVESFGFRPCSVVRVIERTLEDSDLEIPVRLAE